VLALALACWYAEEEAPEDWLDAKMVWS